MWRTAEEVNRKEEENGLLRLIQPEKVLPPLMKNTWFFRRNERKRKNNILVLVAKRCNSVSWQRDRKHASWTGGTVSWLHGLIWYLVLKLSAEALHNGFLVNPPRTQSTLVTDPENQLWKYSSDSSSVERMKSLTFSQSFNKYIMNNLLSR